jgi:hypothetical protein
MLHCFAATYTYTAEFKFAWCIVNVNINDEVKQRSQLKHLNLVKRWTYSCWILWSDKIWVHTYVYTSNKFVFISQSTIVFFFNFNFHFQQIIMKNDGSCFSFKRCIYYIWLFNYIELKFCFTLRYIWTKILILMQHAYNYICQFYI